MALLATYAVCSGATVSLQTSTTVPAVTSRRDTAAFRLGAWAVGAVFGAVFSEGSSMDSSFGAFKARIRASWRGAYAAIA